MLPFDVFPVTRIEQEKNPATQVMQLVSLLEYLLSFVSPGLVGKDNRLATVGDYVDANRSLFSMTANVFFGIGVRNNLIHAKATDATEEEIQRAAGYLFQAVREVRAHAHIPAEIEQEVFAISPDAPTRPVTTSPLPAAPPTPIFRPINQIGQIGQAGQTRLAASTLLPLTAPMTEPVTSPTSYTTRVSPKQPTSTPAMPAQIPSQKKIMTAEPSISTRQIRNAAIAIAVIAAVVFLAKPLWNLGKERMYGSETDTRVTRSQAEAARKGIILVSGKRQGLGAKVAEADAAWRDAEIAFKQERFKDAEAGYRRVLQIGDEIAIKENERKEVEQIFTEMNKTREAARLAQAPQYAAALWQEADNIRRSADTAFRTGDLVAAKPAAVQAQQKYEEAKAAADTVPKPVSTPAPTPTPVVTPIPSNSQNIRPRP
ncbi:MAG: hypothetical protein M3X11_25755 [Acidobacteriota bacterium]|nr:hypothetical protein [Acidobacteriota bacterium]